MKLKNSIILLIILVVVIAGGYVFLYTSKTSAPTVQSGALIIQDQKITDSTKPFKINIDYPKITGLDDFNERVKDIIDKEISDFKTNSLANDKAVKDTDPSYVEYSREYDLNIGYDKGEIDNNIVSVVFDVYNFEGGAHGASYPIALNYNPKTKSEIALADLFPGQNDYLQKISNFCITDLTKQMTTSGAIDMSGSDWISEGAGPNSENFKFFLINPNNTVTFYFPQYQVAAYAAGDFKVTMPR